MPAPVPQVLIPIALVGLGLLFLGGGGQPAAPPPKGLLTGPRQARVHALLGVPSSPFPVGFDITLNDVVAMFQEYRETDLEARQWRGKTRLLLKRGALAPEGFWVAESIPQILERLGVRNGNFIVVHLPVGTTQPRSAKEWERIREGEEPSMELAPLYVNRDAVVKIGPSPVAHYLGRRLARIYTHDGSCFNLYEDLDTLRILVGPGVEEIPYFERR